MAKFKTDQKRVTEEHYYDKAYKEESDRGKVILGAARLDDLLRLLISRALINGDDASQDDILDRTLQSFGAKISSAYRFGLISETEYKNLQIIKDIRNGFAHNLHDISFNHEWVMKQCSSFFLPEPFTPKPNDSSLSLFQSALYKLDLELQHRIAQSTRLTAPQDLIWVKSGEGLIINE